jgi:TetR/AcrR family transcriptional repressor of uid operon
MGATDAENPALDYERSIPYFMRMMMSPTPQTRGRPVDPAARAARRRQILDAARACFAARGFHAASTADISAAAGVSVANMYQYFPSKDDLVVAMAEDDLAADLLAIDALAAVEDFHGGLRDAITGIAAEARDPAASRLRIEIVAEAARNPRVAAVLAACDAAVRRRLERTVRDAQDRGDITRDIPAAAIVSVMLNLADGLFGRFASGMPDADADMAAIADVLDRLLRPRG